MPTPPGTSRNQRQRQTSVDKKTEKLRHDGMAGCHSTRRERALRDIGAPVSLAVTSSFAEADSLEVLHPVWGREDVLWPRAHQLGDDLTDGTASRWIEEQRPSQVM